MSGLDGTPVSGGGPGPGAYLHNMVVPLAQAAQSFALVRSMMESIPVPISGPGVFVYTPSEHGMLFQVHAGPSNAPSGANGHTGEQRTQEFVRGLLRKLADERHRVQYDIPRIERKSCSVKLLSVAFKRHAACRTAVKKKLTAAATRARRLNAGVALKELLSTMGGTRAKLDLELSEATKILEKYSTDLSQGVREKFEVRLGAIQYVVAHCTDESEQLSSRLVAVRSCIEVLTLPPGEFRALVGSLPVYSSQGRIGEAVECLRQVSSECDAARASVDAPGADIATIGEHLQVQASLQSDAFDSIHTEFQAAESAPATVHVKGDVYRISELVDSLPTYESAQNGARGVLERQDQALDALKELFHDIFAVVLTD